MRAWPAHAKLMPTLTLPDSRTRTRACAHRAFGRRRVRLRVWGGDSTPAVSTIVNPPAAQQNPTPAGVTAVSQCRFCQPRELRQSGAARALRRVARAPDNQPDGLPFPIAWPHWGACCYDRRLSVNNAVSCASCHQQTAGFGDRTRFSAGFSRWRLPARTGCASATCAITGRLDVLGQARRHWKPGHAADPE